MPGGLTGPDFVAFIVSNLEVAKTFWTETIGLQLAPTSPPGAHVFQTHPVSFAVRSPRDGELTGVGGTAIWFAFEGDLDAYAALLAERKVAVSTVQPGPFGRFFVFPDPEGRSITVYAKG